MREHYLIRPIREELIKAKVFAEYASYCLEPGKSMIGSQFPHQDDAAEIIAQLTAALALLDKHPDTELYLAANAIKATRDCLGGYPEDQQVHRLCNAVSAIDAARLPACPECRANGSCAVHGGAK